MLIWSYTLCSSKHMLVHLAICRLVSNLMKWGRIVQGHKGVTYRSIIYFLKDGKWPPYTEYWVIHCLKSHSVFSAMYVDSLSMQFTVGEEITAKWSPSNGEVCTKCVHGFSRNYNRNMSSERPSPYLCRMGMNRARSLSSVQITVRDNVTHITFWRYQIPRTHNKNAHLREI
jgi:hypothetical protein